VVRVHHDEGVAIHIGPEPCVVIREDAGEASVGEGIGQPLSRESLIPGADAVLKAEGNMTKCVIASIWRPGVVEEPGMCRSSLYGNREIRPLASGSVSALVRIGKARSHSR
jgi:hypothetical protein